MGDINPSTSSFKYPSDTVLKKLVFQRIKELRDFKSVANKILEDNIKLNNNKKTGWQNRTIEHNIDSLKVIIKNLNKLLRDENRIRKYCLASLGDLQNAREGLSQYTALTFFSDISNYTIPGSISYDLNWLERLSIGEKISISIGKEKPDILEKYWDTQCQFVEHRIGKINRPSLSEPLKLLSEAISVAKKGFHTSSNLVLFSICERLVRYITTNLYYHQNKGISWRQAEAFIDNCQSLESLLLNIHWANDLEYPITRIAVEYGYVPEAEIKEINQTLIKAKSANQHLATKIDELLSVISLEKDAGGEILSGDGERKINETLKEMKQLGNDLLPTKNEKRKINIRIKLHFLIRRFKDDRNAIIHGQFEGFKFKWKNYIYLSAVAKIFDTIEEYDKIYQLN